MKVKLVLRKYLPLLLVFSLFFVACSNKPKEVVKESVESMEDNKKIIIESFDKISEENARNIACGFDELGIEIKKLKIEEKIKRNGRLVGYIVRVEACSNNIYYLQTDNHFWMYEIRKDNVNGKLVYMTGDDINPEIDINSVEENNKKIIIANFNVSDKNAEKMAYGFSESNIKIKRMKIEEDVLVGYTIRVEDHSNNIYYLQADYDFGIYEIRKDSIDGEIVYMTGVD